MKVECTYPLDESIGTAMIFMSGQIQGGVLIALSQVLLDLKTGLVLLMFTIFKATLSFVLFYHNFHDDIIALYVWCIQVLQQPLDKEALEK